MNIPQRFKSKVFWVSVVTNIITICQLTGVWERVGVDVGVVTEVAMIVINTAVTIFGLANNPTDSTNF